MRIERQDIDHFKSVDQARAYRKARQAMDETAQVLGAFHQLDDTAADLNKDRNIVVLDEHTTSSREAPARDNDYAIVTRHTRLSGDARFDGRTGEATHLSATKTGDIETRYGHRGFDDPETDLVPSRIYRYESSDTGKMWRVDDCHALSTTTIVTMDNATGALYVEDRSAVVRLA